MLTNLYKNRRIIILSVEYSLTDYGLRKVKSEVVMVIQEAAV